MLSVTSNALASLSHKVEAELCEMKARKEGM